MRPTPGDPTKLTKAQAATRAGVSTKTIEKWTKEGRLEQTRWRRPGGGPEIVVYLPEDVDRIAQERRPAPPAFVLPPIPTTTGNGNGLHARSDGGQALVLTPATPAGYDAVRLFIETLVAAVMSESSQSSEKSEKVFLTVAEAAAVSGLPQADLRQLIEAGDLPHRRTRRGGIRIRRRDLEQL